MYELQELIFEGDRSGELAIEYNNRAHSVSHESGVSATCARNDWPRTRSARYNGKFEFATILLLIHKPSM